MPNPTIVMAGASIASTGAQVFGASKAASAQTKSARMGIKEERRQFDKLQRLLAPFVEGGTDAFGEMLKLSGARGDKFQKRAIRGIEQGAEFETLMQQGENAILSNASATGGLRGGDTQGALAEYRPQLLNQLVQQRYGQFAGLATMGQNSAAQTGTSAMQMGSNIAGLYGDMGAAQAGGYLAAGQGIANGIGGISQALGYYSANAPDGATLFGQWGF